MQDDTKDDTESIKLKTWNENMKAVKQQKSGKAGKALRCFKVLKNIKSKQQIKK